MGNISYFPFPLMESNQATVQLQSAKMKGRELASPRADRFKLNARPRHESHDTASPRLLELPTENICFGTGARGRKRESKQPGYA